MPALNIGNKIKQIEGLIEEGKKTEAVNESEETLKEIFAYVLGETENELNQRKKGKLEKYKQNLDKPIERYSLSEFLELFVVGNILETYQELKGITLKSLNKRICKSILEEYSEEKGNKNERSIVDEDPNIAYSMLNTIARDFNLLPMNPITKKFYDLVEDLSHENLQEFTKTFSFDVNWEKLNSSVRIPQNTGLYIGACPHCEKSVRMIYDKFYTGHKYYALECPYCHQKIGCHNRFAGLTSELNLDKYDPSNSNKEGAQGLKIEQKQTLLKKLDELNRSQDKLGKE